ncbi:MAG: hypothetical protein ACJAZ9_001491 [Neolewinella sp.]|jgi:hypothetical protein
MKIRHLFMSLALLLSFTLSAQITSHQKVNPPTDIFVSATQKSAGSVLKSELSNYDLLETPAETYTQLKASAPGNWSLSLPSTSLAPEGLILNLRPRQILREDFRLRLASTNDFLPNADLGLHYEGEIAGEANSRVALSLLDGEMTATITRPNGERLALGRVAGQTKATATETYILFPEKQLLERQELDCATADSGIPYSGKELSSEANMKAEAGCVDIFFEIDYDIFLDKGSAVAAAQHLAANFNEVTILYDAIGVNLKASEIMVWDQVSPYAGASSSAMLTQFQSVRTQFNGDLAQLISYQASGGIAVLDGLCHPFVAARMSFSSIRSNFAAVPIYSWSTMVISHELGHLMGSQHTHACVWNNNNTAIDGCPGWTEGLCSTPGIPASGGTIMSYCHLTSVGINFNSGFGPQPTAVIQNRVTAAQGCVQAICSDGNGDDDDDGEDPQPPINCDNQTVFLRLVLDDFGMETTWELKAEAGGVLASGGPYPKKQKDRVILDTICVPDGCYLFEIKDDDFDGICCNYGPGLFELTDTIGNLLGSGGQFDTLDIIDFCLPDVPDTGDDDADCTAFDFEENPIISYGTNQDIGAVTVVENGDAIELKNNAWKAIDLPYTVTEDTWLSFWFRSTKQGEVHGIGLDDNNVISANLTFKLYGTQDWGLQGYSTYPGDGQWKLYQIPVGEFYTGNANYLFFTADHDVGTRDGNSYFRHVILSEGGPCGGVALPGTGALVPETNKLELLPNPVSEVLNVRLGDVTASGTFRVLDLTGRTVANGQLNGGEAAVSVATLPAGTYIFRYENGEGGETRRFTVAH